MAKSQWATQLRDASFRGVKFYVESHEYHFGRRSQIHEFPDRDTPFAEDLGKASDKFSIEGHILGDDYFTTRDSFIKACQEEGPGELIHPYLGSRFVQIVSVAIREDTKAGRICTFTAEFVEAGEVKFPAASEDTVGSILSASERLQAASRANFVKGFDASKLSTSSTPIDIFGVARSGIDKAKSALRRFTKAINDATKPLKDTEQFVDYIRRETKRFERDINSLLQTPGTLWDRIQNLANVLLKAGGSDKAKRAKAVRPLVGFGRPGKPSAPKAVTTPTPKTPSSEQAQKNEDLIHQAVQIQAISNVTVDESQTKFASIDDAIQERFLLVEEMNLIQTDAENDEIYQSLSDIKSLLVKSMPDEQTVLPVIKTIQNRQTLPSIVISYDLYEDDRKESDIIARNKIRHPGFVPGGTDLEVLSA